VESVLKLVHEQIKSFLELENDVNLGFVSFRLGVKGTIDPAGTGRAPSTPGPTGSLRPLPRG
jgi:hypothetical protein